MRRRVLIGLAVGLAMLALALWGVPLEELGHALSAVRWAWLVPLAAIFLVQQALRALRQLLIVQPLAPHTTYWRQLGILCIGFFCINTLPARLGEVVRPTLLLERDGVPLGAGFGVVFVERVLDLASALGMLLLVLFYVEVEPLPLVLAGATIELTDLARTLGGTLLVPLLLVLVALILVGRPVLELVDAAVSFTTRRLPWGPLATVGRIGLAFTRAFVDAVQGLRTPWRFGAIVGLTVVIWGLTGWMYVCLAHGVGIADRVGYGEGIGVLCITMLGTALPSPPGFAGVYEAAVRGALALFGVVGGERDGQALAFALIIHWYVFLVQAATALWFFATERVSVRRLWQLALESTRQAA